MELRYFDAVTYDVGDIVISKNKDDKPKPEKIVKSIMINRLSNNYQYNVIFFESNPRDFHVAYEYEPYDKKERKEYYKIWNENSTTSKPSKKTNNKTKSKVINLNLKK